MAGPFLGAMATSPEAALVSSFEHGAMAALDPHHQCVALAS